MAFVSWAQNGEDVVLWRALSHVKAGYYIDVGASDPVIDSVTKAFYDAGWSGLNVEPVHAYYEALVATRLRDMTLQCALGATNANLPFFEVPGTGLSTLEPRWAEKARERGFRVIESITKVRRLADLLEELQPETIHFLKIDAQGAELAVLEGADLKRWHPWVLVVKAIMPAEGIMEATSSHEAWEPLVLKAGYVFCLFDGVNRFYVAKEHEDLLAALSFPACALDDFKPARLVELEAAEQQVPVLQARLDSNETLLRDVEAEAAELVVRNHELETALEAILASTSWRITAPMRNMKDKSAPKVRRLRQRFPAFARAEHLLRSRLGTLIRAAQVVGKDHEANEAEPLSERAEAFRGLLEWHLAHAREPSALGQVGSAASSMPFSGAIERRFP